MELVLVAHQFRTNVVRRHELPFLLPWRWLFQSLKNHHRMAMIFNRNQSSYFSREILCWNKHRQHTLKVHLTHPLPILTYEKNKQIITYTRTCCSSYRDSGACRPFSSRIFVRRPMGFLICQISLISFPTR